MVGSAIVHQASWGAKNKYLGIVGVLSVCTIFAFDGLYADMTKVTFSGRNATGYYANFMYLSTQLGAMPEASALTMTAPDGSAMPDWGTAYKTSGLSTVGIDMVADVDNGKIYSGGTPQLTCRIRGVLAYDPRLDSTQPSGSGTQRAQTESTYAYSDNPWVHAATYAIGRWQNGVRVFGPGLGPAQVEMSAYMEAANVADANGWKISGQILSTDNKWDTLKAMCQAGGGYPMPTGAHLSCLVNAPKVSLATITSDDVKGTVTAPQMLTRRSRYNGAIPTIRCADQGWQPTALDALRSSTYLAADGGKASTLPITLTLVADKGDGAGKTQAAQIAAYEAANSRERSPISIPLGYQWSQYKLGDCLTVDLPEANLNSQKCVVIGRTINPGQNTVTLVFRTEDDAKHTWALGVAGSTATPPTIAQPPGTGDLGGPVSGSAILRASYPKNLSITSSDAGSSATIHLFGASGGAGTNFTIDYALPTPQDVSVPFHDITGLAYSTTYYVYADVTAPGDAAPTYGATTTYGDALNSAAHPLRVYLNQLVTTPAAGGGTTTGDDSGGGYGSCVTVDATILMADGALKPAGEIRVGDMLRTRHEHTLEWGDHRVIAARIVPDQPVYRVEIDGKVIHATKDHRVHVDGAWTPVQMLGRRDGSGDIVKITVADAHTYVSNGILSHNIKMQP